MRPDLISLTQFAALQPTKRGKRGCSTQWVRWCILHNLIEPKPIKIGERWVLERSAKILKAKA